MYLVQFLDGVGVCVCACYRLYTYMHACVQGLVGWSWTGSVPLRVFGSGLKRDLIIVAMTALHGWRGGGGL